MTEHVDVLIIGAGLSGIGAAAHLTRELPHTSYAVLEARAVSGGTWDLFRYPGIRSVSDMYTMGYRFKPWLDEESLAPGHRILDYVRATATEYDVDRHIRYDHRVVRASWSSADARWTVEAEQHGEPVTFTAGFLWSCRGYYDYEAGHEPEFAGASDFTGRVVHPQAWPDDLEWAGKRVVVIGSGATAVTLVPTLARDAAHVTMLQRSPSYVMSLPRRDPVALRLRRWLPVPTAHRVIRWKNIVTTAAFYRLSRHRPALVRRLIRRQNAAQLPQGYDVDTHFTPTYDPWDQRMCFVPNGDLFRAVRRGRAEVVTATIDRFDQTGVVLTGGRHLDAELIVTATGLRLSPFGGIDLMVDGRPVDPAAEITYKALMLTGVPNFVFTVGYTNASWTLKVDLVAEFCCRLLAFMSERHYRRVVPVRDPSVQPLPFMDFTSGYVLRALDQLPRQGDREPWRLRQSYLRDRRTIRHGALEDGVLAFE
ncbi:MAG: monooxygenase [Solirubrobacteraceae bacterium]|nr:monooxygenase [Solirubrobacteraceae bacterium]